MANKELERVIQQLKKESEDAQKVVENTAQEAKEMVQVSEPEEEYEEEEEYDEGEDEVEEVEVAPKIPKKQVQKFREKKMPLPEKEKDSEVANQIALLQNDGIWRLEVLYNLQKLNNLIQKLIDNR